ncbi:MAG: hypothetical protein ABIQ16_11955 [Polyangiaceae bacterium]
MICMPNARILTRMVWREMPSKRDAEQARCVTLIAMRVAENHAGQRLGTVGSRIVAETLIALVQRHRASFLNHPGAAEIKPNGIEVAPGHVIGSIADLLSFSGAPL